MGAVIYGQDQRVVDWVAAQCGYEPPAANSAIGYERDGELVAGVFFDCCTDNNVFAHIASTAEIFPIDLLIACGAYVWGQCKLERVTYIVNDDNTKAIKFCEQIGAKLEGRMHRGHKNGDTLIFALFEKDCHLWQKVMGKT